MSLYQRAGVITRGKRLGTALGFPTANIVYEPFARTGSTNPAPVPPDGVYIGIAVLGGRRYVCILNQGHHPTAPEGAPTVEAHLLDYAGGDLYGERITLIYQRFLRKEIKFDSLADLRAQLETDKAAAREWQLSKEPEA